MLWWRCETGYFGVCTCAGTKWKLQVVVVMVVGRGSRKQEVAVAVAVAAVVVDRILKEKERTADRGGAMSVITRVTAMK